jgi:hypothetical protein
MFQKALISKEFIMVPRLDIIRGSPGNFSNLGFFFDEIRIPEFSPTYWKTPQGFSS